MVVTLGQQYHVGEKPTAILYIYINRQHAGTPNKTKTMFCIAQQHHLLQSMKDFYMYYENIP